MWLSKATLPRLSESHGPTHIGPSRSSLGNGGIETSSVAPDSQLPKHSRPAVRTHTHTQSSNPSQIITNLCVNMPFTCEQRGGGVLRRGGIASSLSWQILCYPRMTESCLHIYVLTGHGIGMAAIPAGWRGLLWDKIHAFNTSGKYMFASYRGAVAVCLSCEKPNKEEIQHPCRRSEQAVFISNKTDFGLTAVCAAAALLGKTYGPILCNHVKDLLRSA